MEELKARIQKETNMVGISLIIGSGVFWHFAERFGKEVRKFNKSKETQESWVNSVNSHFKSEINEAKAELIKAIPDRFKKSAMYRGLYN